MERDALHHHLWYTQEILAHAPRYGQWIIGHFQPYLGERVLEVGCGLGNFTPYLLQASLLVSLDVMPEAVERVNRQWGHLPHVRPLLGDITQGATLELLSEMAPFDTIVFINVLEHIPQDDVALLHTYRLLDEGGHLVLYVPAQPGLFGSLDQALGHCRRYTRQGLLHLLARTGFTPVFCRPVNALGAAAWWFDGKVRRYQRLPLWQVRLFNALVPFLRPVEHMLRSVWPAMPGLSLACVARRLTTAHHVGVET